MRIQHGDTIIMTIINGLLSAHYTLPTLPETTITTTQSRVYLTGSVSEYKEHHPPPSPPSVSTQVLPLRLGSTRRRITPTRGTKVPLLFFFGILPSRIFRNSTIKSSREVAFLSVAAMFELSVRSVGSSPIADLLCVFTPKISWIFPQ